jgi:hypothetical protein
MHGPAGSVDNNAVDENPLNLSLMKHNIEFSCAAASTCAAWNSGLHAPIQAKSKASTATI